MRCSLLPNEYFDSYRKVKRQPLLAFCLCLWSSTPAMAGRRQRGRTLRVPESWLAQVRAFWEHSGKTLQQLGVELAPLVGEERPLLPRRVHDYINGKSTTEEMTAAFAKLMETRPPVLGLDGPEIQRWCAAGQRLLEHAPEQFQAELLAVERLLSALEEFMRRR